MIFITKRTSETGKKLQEIKEKVDRIHKQQVSLSKEFGFNGWRSSCMSSWGGFSALIFKETPDTSIYRLVKDTNEWMPKRNTKIGKQIYEKLQSTEKVGLFDLNKCVGFQERGFETIGVNFKNNEYFGFTLKNDWPYTPPIDCEEVTYSRYRELFQPNLNNMATVIQLKSKEDFKKCRDAVKDKSTLSWKMYMWDWVQEETCYYPEQDCFVSLTRAEEMGLSVEPFNAEKLK